MPRQPLPDWMEPAIDGRFNDLAWVASRMDEIGASKASGDRAATKQELTPLQFNLILEWEETLNYRHTVEKEWMYRAGLKDGIQMARILQVP